MEPVKKFILKDYEGIFHNAILEVEKMVHDVISSGRVINEETDMSPIRHFSSIWRDNYCPKVFKKF